MKTMKKTASILFLLTAAFFLQPSSTTAQTAMGLSAIPPRLEILVEPGKHISKEIKVRNESQTEKFITTNIKDFIVTDSIGTPIPLEGVSQEDNRWAASSWIQVSPTQIKLKPGETKSLILTVIAPADALPGGHYAMVLHNPQIDVALDSTGAAVETNVGTLVYITIPGDIKEDARIVNFSTTNFSEFGPINFETTIENLSDIHINPKGQITIKNMLGGTTAQLNLNESNIFPYTQRDFENKLDKKWLFGRYQAQVNAAYGSTGGLLTATIFFWVIPWRLITFALALITLITLLVIILKNKDQDSGTKPQSSIPSEPDLENLKNKYRDKT
jgi:hypothetical protein